MNGRRGVQVLEVGVPLVLRVPLPVVGEGHHLPCGLVGPDVDVGGPVAVLPRGVLVDVVAEVDDRVEVVAGREVAVGGEPAGLQVGARDHAEPQPLGRRGRRGRRPGAAGAAGRALEEEAEEVRRGGREAAGLHLHGVVAARVGADPPVRHHVAGSGRRAPPASGPAPPVPRPSPASPPRSGSAGSTGPRCPGAGRPRRRRARSSRCRQRPPGWPLARPSAPVAAAPAAEAASRVRRSMLRSRRDSVTKVLMTQPPER